MRADVTANTLATGETTWDESVPVAKVIYKVYGHTGRDQFALGIVEQPGWLENRLICSRLRNTFGDISDVAGFDKQGNLILQKYNDALIPVWDDRHIVRLGGYATRQLLKMVE